MTIPVIDLASVWTGDAETRRELAADIARTCEDIGFFLIANHGVARPILDHAFAVASEYFALPAAEKSLHEPKDPAAPRGYHALGTRNLAKTIGEVAPPDLREQFFIGPLDPDAARFAHVAGSEIFYADNHWPSQPEAYRAAFTEYYRALETLGAELMRLFALALDLPENYFDDKIDGHFNTCPANHYPPVPTNAQQGQIRAGAHTDYGSLTILAFDDAPGGLQVRMANGNWHDVVPAPGQFVVNIGDLMQRWTNDRWRSTLHRVVNPSDPALASRARQTISYFMNPNFDCLVECLKSCQGPGNPARHAPILAGDHMHQKIRSRVVG